MYCHASHSQRRPTFSQQPNIHSWPTSRRLDPADEWPIMAARVTGRTTGERNTMRAITIGAIASVGLILTACQNKQEKANEAVAESTNAAAAASDASAAANQAEAATQNAAMAPGSVEAKTAGDLAAAAGKEAEKAGDAAKKAGDKAQSATH